MKTNSVDTKDGTAENSLVLATGGASLLIEATAEGLMQGRLLPFFNRGMITLLQKDGDSTLLTNKRPITLLNAVYKVWAKALQLRLSPVLQRLVTWEQNAFLPGRNLHSTVFLCNEAVHEAKALQQDAVLLKIDFKKAFDTLRWQFIYDVMEKMQFGQVFISFVQALNTNAASSVRINNTITKTFQISRSVRQGCPLSPLLFTIAIQTLTDGVNLKLRMGEIKGIILHSIGIQYCQGYFADDSHLLLAADRSNLVTAKNLLHQFGTASGLKVQWGKSVARWISDASPIPTWTSELDWVWGAPDQAEKFLGFHFTDTLQEESIFLAAKQKITAKINSPSARSTTIHGRIVIANHIIYGIIWFLLPLWTGDKGRLRTLERLILNYVWGGNSDTTKKHRVAERVLHQRKSEGGLGLMSLQAQSQAFVAKTVRWAYTPGQHPLKDWIRSKFQEIAELRWNSSHFTWVTSPSRGAFPPLSPLMLRVCKAWQTTAKLLAPLRNLPLLPWKKISLWGPKTPGIRGLTRSASKGQNARLKDAGVVEIGDITDNGTIFRQIEDAVSGVPPSNATRRAYDRLLSSTPRHTAGYRSHSLYATPHAANPTICIRLADEAPLDDTILNSTHARLAFQISEGTLLPSNLRDIPTETNWVRVPIATVWRPQGKQPARHVLSWEDSNSLIAALQWRDQSGFLAAPNANIRRIATTDTSTILDRIRKWVRSHHIDPTNVNRWLKLWKKKRPIKFSILQWNIFFRSIPTNTWRHPQLSRDQQETWCVCCDTRSAEDIQHLLWTCPIAAQIWEWAIDVTNIAFPETRRWTPRSTHTILGEDLPQHCKAAAYWWENWRLIILWSIWSQRNDVIFRNSRVNLGKVKASAWNKLLVQTRKDWALHCKDTANLELTLLRRIDRDRRMTRRLAIQTLRLKITGHNLLGSWRPP
ncbi:hypothetical protein R1sor_016026 [Riccia sorocarpa]|uniref:Reverse transcriptase domain-containing protein n=1 Tax=Riccia sorocarpa TaxID=122646 RepID=A0ABD3HDW1_9MARC